ncbi:MAG: crossover junction endodeoxyribonuclease RuvC [Actinomycetota bacterium]
MGVDPGLTRTGFGVVEQVGGALSALSFGTIATSPTQPTPGRLAALFEGITEAIACWAPEAVAVERVFYNVNVRTAVPVAQAAGMALLAAARSGTEVHEYGPLEVKQAVVGVGGASKEQVRFMVERLLRLVSTPDTADAADGLAVAICHLHSWKLRARAKVSG